MLNTSMINEPIIWTDFAITTYCQARCRSCQRTNQDTGQPEDWLIPSHMPYDLFDKVLTGSPDKLKTIQFCGELGDPMMHPDITKFVDRALSKESVNRLIINTNGGLRTPDWYTKMGNKHGHGFVIIFGIDGITHESNWKYREGVDWQRAMDNMIAMANTDAEMEWHFLIFEWNWQEVTEAYAMAKEHGININFKFNTRSLGLISDENKAACKELIEELK